MLGSTEEFIHHSPRNGLRRVCRKSAKTTSHPNGIF